MPCTGAQDTDRLGVARHVIPAPWVVPLSLCIALAGVSGPKVLAGGCSGLGWR